MAIKIKKETKTTKINCPYCGIEYKDYDIFIPANILDKGSYERDIHGTIIEENVTSKACLEEIYNCDECLKTFKVSLLIKYRVEEMEDTTIPKEDSIKLALS